MSELYHSANIKVTCIRVQYHEGLERGRPARNCQVSGRDARAPTGTVSQSTSTIFSCGIGVLFSQTP